MTSFSTLSNDINILLENSINLFLKHFIQSTHINYYFFCISNDKQCVKKVEHEVDDGFLFSEKN